MKRYLILFFTLVCVTGLWANNVRFAVDGPRQVIQGQQFQLEYTLYNASGKDLKLPEFKGCKVLYQGTSSGTSVSVVNGKVDRQTTETHVITLRAEKEGSYTFAPATISADGRTLSTNTWKLTVLPPDKASASSGRSGGQSSDNTTLFARLILSKSRIYEQEAVLATIKLYTQASGVQAENYSFPSFEGFVVQDIDLPQNTSFSLENYNGVNYKVAVLKQCLLFPQRTGKITITPGKFDFQVETYQLVNGPFGPMRVPQGVSRSVSTNTTSVEVMPLPSGKPASFMGGVGDFSLSSSISSTHVKANEAITLKLTIKGSGNLKYLKNPELQLPNDFDTYDPKVDVNVKASAEFSYFDIKSKSYKTLRTEAYEITVDKGAPGSGGKTVTNFSNKEDLKLLNQDIHYIKLDKMNLVQTPTLYIDNWVYWLWYIVPALAFIVFVIINRKQAKANANVALMKNRKANKVASKRLKVAGKYLKNHDREHFYDEVLKAVWGYLSDKLGLPNSELTKDNVAAELEKYGASTELIAEFNDILGRCEFAQYAPSQTDEAMDELYTQTVEAIGKMENTVKK